MTINNRYSDLLISFDRASDYLPIMGTLTNAVTLGKKLHKKILHAESTPQNDRYARYLSKKSAPRCALLMLPIVGFLAVKLYDFLHEEKRTPNGYTPLISAVIMGHKKNAGALIKQGVDVDACDTSGFTALMHAANEGYIGITTDLLNANADTEAQNLSGQTALMLAAAANRPEITELLAKSGANLEARDHQGRTALINAIREGSEQAVDKLMALGANLDTRDLQGGNALMWAASLGQTAIVEKLLQAGANPEARDATGYTAMAYAALHKRDETIRTLAGRGANVNTHDNSNCTPLARAVLVNAPPATIETLKQQNAHEDYATEYVERKFLANLWGVAGKSLYKEGATKKDKKSLQHNTFNLEGFQKPYAISKLSRYLTEFFASDRSIDTHLSQDDQRTIAEAVKEAEISGQANLERMQERIQAGKPVVIMGGSKRHAISMVILNGKLIVCNRGEGTLIHAVKHYKLPKSKINDTFLKNLTTEYASTSNFKKMISGLRLKCTHRYRMKDQSVGNCVLASLKAAIGELCIEHAGKSGKNRKIGRGIYKNYTDFARKTSLKEYLEKSKNPDRVLLGKLKKKSKGKQGRLSEAEGWLEGAV